MNLTLFMQVLPKAGLGWLGVFAVTIIIVAAVELLEHFKPQGGNCAVLPKMSDLPNNSETVSIGGDLPTMGVLKGR